MMCSRALIAVAAISVMGMGCGVEFLHAFAFGVLITGGLSVMAVIGRVKTIGRSVGELTGK